MSQRLATHPADRWDESTESVDGSTDIETIYHPSSFSETYSYSATAAGLSHGTLGEIERSIDDTEVIELVRAAVENGRQETQRSLAGTEGVSEAVALKLTIDLGHQNIQKIPYEVVSIIKDEVARCVHPYHSL